LSKNPILGHITTFGGNALSAAASLATLRTLEAEKIYETAPQKHELFKQYLKHPAIKAIRGRGLMMAVEFESFEFLKKVIDKCLEKGVLTDWFLYCDNAMRIAPPLIITEKQIRKACQLILEAIEEVSVERAN
jgi:acetylornithine/succinyldiaminopimelate/putrescine aminotransferase